MQPNDSVIHPLFGVGKLIYVNTTLCSIPFASVEYDIGVVFRPAREFALVGDESMTAPSISIADAIKFIEERQGKLYSIVFTKRSTGEERQMVCRQNVVSHLKGGEKAYDATAKGLITTFDFQKNAYRSIPIEGIKRIKMHGDWVEVTH